jgi:hypothetical protein
LGWGSYCFRWTRADLDTDIAARVVRDRRFVWSWHIGKLDRRLDLLDLIRDHFLEDSGGLNRRLRGGL